MKSPKFDHKRNKISGIFHRGRIKRVWKDNVRPRLRGDIIEDPIEFLDYHVEITHVSVQIQKTMSEGQYHPARPERILIEKSKGMCRQMVVPSVKDALVLQVLSDEIWNKIRNSAPTTRAFFEPHDMTFTPQKQGELAGIPYGGFRAWLKFQKELFKFPNTKKYIIVTDLANYYDSISYGHLRNIISGWVDVDEETMDLILFVLSGLLWQPDYMPRIEVGLPQIDLDAPRVLAHCFLFELDAFLDDKANGHFVRFMDDIDIGADDIMSCRALLRDIDLLLQTRQVRLNAGKTKILTSADAYRHFFIKENRIIDNFIEKFNKKIENGHSTERNKKSIKRIFEKKYRMGHFDSGNGNKIIKRIVNFSMRAGIELDPNVMYSIVCRYADVRESGLRYCATQGQNSKYFPVIENFLTRYRPVDDAGVVLAAKMLCEAVVTKWNEVDSLKQFFVSEGKGLGRFGVFAALWILARFGDPKEIWDYVYKTYTVWETEYRVGRMVGGLFPRLKNTPYQANYENLLEQSRNDGALEVLNFQRRLCEDKKAFLSVKNILDKNNTSKTLAITSSKWLMVVAVLSNQNIPEKERAVLISKHAKAWSDVFMKSIAQSATGSAKLVSKFP